ncbi:MAG: hypothetical protein ACOCYZ_04460 [Halococcoides sp.]
MVGAHDQKVAADADRGASLAAGPARHRGAGPRRGQRVSRAARARGGPGARPSPAPLELETVLEKRAAAGTATLIATPRAETAARLADRLFLLDPDGRLVADDAMTVLQDTDRLAACRLAPPPTVALFEAAGLDDPPIDRAAAIDRLESLAAATPQIDH